MSYERILTATALLLIAYGAFVALGAQNAFPAGMTDQGAMPFLSDKPVGEDGFYMLTAAWNWGTGRGLTIGGEPTTGIQPLATLVYAGASALVSVSGGTRVDLVRVVIVLGTLNVVGLALLLGALARQALPTEAPPDARRALYFLAALLTLTSFGVFRLATYGLETGMYLALLAAFALAAVRTVREPSARLVVALGLLAGLCGVARIDFGVLLAVFLGVLVLRRRLALRHAIAVGSLALLIVAPWFVYVYSATGAWMPSSGPAQSSPITAAEAPRRVLALGIALVDHATPWAFTGVSSLLMAGLALVSLVALGIGLRVWREKATATTQSAWVETIGAFGAGVAVLAIVYVSTFYAWYFYARYTAPLVVVTVPVLAVWIVRSVSAERVRRASLPVAVGLVTLFAVWAGLSLHRGAVANTHAVTAGFVAAEYPDATVGAFQSGTIGYFHEGTVNLDGKVNARALRAAQSGALGAYVDASEIDVLLDWPTFFEAAFDSAAFAARWRPCPARPPNDATVCYERRPTEALHPRVR